LPVFAAYNIPGRDCSQYSAGGASTEEEYRAWIDAVAEGIGRHRAVVLLEPDGVALLPSEPWCAEGGGGFTADPEDLERVEERFRELRYAVDRLEGLPRVDVYLDAGHSAWHPLNDYDAYYGEPQLQFGIVSRLVLAGIDRATGFFLNPSNYRATEDLVTYGERVAKCVALVQQDPAYVVPEIYVPNVVYDAEGRFASPCPPTEELDAMPLTAEIVRRMPHFVVDTSRNGQGAWNLGDPDTTADDAAAFFTRYGYETTDPQIWCNAPGSGLGPRPTTRTGHPLVDAFVWIKVPGESDGQCNRNLTAPDPNWPANYDVAWGQVDPPAGQWFEAQALELATLAVPPLLP
jgi:endoglucanase